MGVLIVYVTVPGIETARRIARTIVEERLAACCNLLPSVESIYRWEGKIEEAGECLMLIKTIEETFDRLRDRIVTLHPYDVPEIIAAPVAHGLEAYLKWIVDSC